MQANPGHLPPEAAGKRVRVRLRNGVVTKPEGWAADGRGECRWSLTGHDFDIVAYEVVGG